MSRGRYEYCEIADTRRCMAERLDELPAFKGQHENAGQFWARVENAGLLPKALALYDEVSAERAAWRRVRRETKQEFAQRIEREGRQAEAERLREELLASRLSHREAQEELVERLQPLDGSETRAWETPDPWEAGRLFRKKADQKRLLQLAREDEDDDEEDDEDEDEQVAEAEKRVAWAKFRRAERCALATARQRARAVTAAELE